MSGCPWALNPFVENTTVFFSFLFFFLHDGFLQGASACGLSLKGHSCRREGFTGGGPGSLRPGTRCLSFQQSPPGWPSSASPMVSPLRTAPAGAPELCVFRPKISLVLTETLTAATYVKAAVTPEA